MNPEREALEVLRRRGWCKDHYSDDDGRVCIQRAYSMATAPDAIKIDLFTRFDSTSIICEVSIVCEVVAEQFPDRWSPGASLEAFNDHPDTTFDDVVLVLEKAALRREETVL